MYDDRKEIEIAERTLTTSVALTILRGLFWVVAMAFTAIYVMPFALDLARILKG